MKRLKLVLLVVCLSSILFAGCSFVNKKTMVYEGNSMSPTLKDQDRFVVDTRYYEDHQVNRGDIILYTYEGKQNVKRVLGLPDEIIQINNGEWYIDREILIADYVLENSPSGVFEDLDKGITLKDDEYFIVGDSPRSSKDSRYIGPINKTSILGKVIKIKSK